MPQTLAGLFPLGATFLGFPPALQGSLTSLSLLFPLPTVAVAFRDPWIPGILAALPLLLLGQTCPEGLL